MKKLKLNFQQLDSVEILSREKLKNILGGVGSDSSNSCNMYCGSGTGVTCSGSCSNCVDAGNASGVRPGQDMYCVV